jgi:tripartite-type tricarboxylate transporter receptor subunit TctC
LAESGIAGNDTVAGYGLLEPAKTPAAPLSRVGDSIIRTLRSTVVKRRVLSGGIEALGAPAERMEAAIHADHARWGKLIRLAGIKDD